MPDPLVPTNESEHLRALCKRAGWSLNLRAVQQGNTWSAWAHVDTGGRPAVWGAGHDLADRTTAEEAASRQALASLRTIADGMAA